jgi:hypothetical protein
VSDDACREPDPEMESDVKIVNCDWTSVHDVSRRSTWYICRLIVRNPCVYLSLAILVTSRTRLLETSRPREHKARAESCMECYAVQSGKCQACCASMRARALCHPEVCEDSWKQSGDTVEKILQSVVSLE